MTPEVPRAPAMCFGTAARDVTISGGHAFAHAPVQ